MRLLAYIVLLLVSIPALAQEGVFDWQSSTVQSFAPGVAHVELDVPLPRPMRVNAVRVDTQQPGLKFVTTSRYKDWEANKNETEREPARDFLREANEAGLPMVLAVNGDGFMPWPAPWNAADPANLSGLAIANGEVVSPPSGSPSFLVHSDGRVRITVTDKDTDLTGVVTAVSGFGLSLKDGTPVGEGDDHHPRTGIGVSEDGRYVILATIDGRRHDSHGATIAELGAWLKHFGAHKGINLDGGGSTTMVRWNPALEGPDKTEVLNVPVGDGVNWLKRDPSLEKLLAQPNERYNGNHLGVVVKPTP